MLSSTTTDSPSPTTTDMLSLTTNDTTSLTTTHTLSSTTTDSPSPTTTDRSSLTTTHTFRPGSVVVECTLAFRQGTTDALNVWTRLDEHRAEAARYGMSISSVRVRDASFPSAAGSGSGVPGWGIALLVLVCVLLALAVVYLVVLTVCQCRRKNCGQLDLFPPRDAYHPMSEYPTYHTHGRYIPPGSTRRSPYEEVSAGNGGGSLAYTNLAATSADL
uniref:Mucin-1 n=1 Tax=Panthera leo TaxID=9689 RepID=A0A8C8X8Q6_PANLE